MRVAVRAEGPQRPRARPGGRILRGAGAAAALAALGAASEAASGRPLLLINPTPSEPPGLYLANPVRPGVGQIIAFTAPAAAFPYADRRLAYLHRVPLLKAVAAGPGDQVCTRAGRLSINGRDRAGIALADGRGVRLPRWTGCRTLAADELFVFSSRVPNSFDSRYFGPVSAKAVIGVYRRIPPAEAGR
jgi:conjugative transfer signal peptidase TraF